MISYEETLKNEGKTDGKIEVAKNMLKNDFPLHKIKELTQLPESVIKKLKDER